MTSRPTGPFKEAIISFVQGATWQPSRWPDRPVQYLCPILVPCCTPWKTTPIQPPTRQKRLFSCSSPQLFDRTYPEIRTTQNGQELSHVKVRLSATRKSKKHLIINYFFLHPGKAAALCPRKPANPTIGIRATDGLRSTEACHHRRRAPFFPKAKSPHMDQSLHERPVPPLCDPPPAPSLANWGA